MTTRLTWPLWPASNQTLETLEAIAAVVAAHWHAAPRSFWPTATHWLREQASTITALEDYHFTNGGKLIK